jgi:transposase
MLLWIAIVGGLTLMMGQHARAESLFYYFRLEDQVAENHLLRLVDKHIDFGFVRERLKDSYSETGRPSIDPELLLRILLIGYLYGISSERKLVEELRMHLAWRWFTGLGFDQEVPHHSTFSKNRHGRFQESTVFEQLFEEVVAQCLAVGLVRGDKLSVDGTFVEANASKESRIPREQLAEAAQVNRTVREYLAELESRTQSRSRHIAKTRCPPPIRTPHMRQKAGRRHAWVITTTTWLTTTAASSWACKRQALA